MRLSIALRSLPLWLIFLVPLFAASALLGESASAQSQPPHPLNDTGIDWCADGDSNNLACPVSGYPGQDGEYGRDVTDHDDRDGHAGFSYTKLDAQGRDLPADATAWSCVRDNVTGAIWEVKADDGGLRDKDWTYSWYDPDSPDGVSGTENGGNCATSGRCDTEKYVEDVNAQGLCGFTDWRMPTIKELAGIAHLGRTDPSIDTGYFPNTLSTGFWSASPRANLSNYAWIVYFDYGVDYRSYKSSNGAVRLVRGGQWSLSFVDNDDGTISDANTGLMWAQCSAGQSGANCGTGSADSMTWQAALSYAENATFAGYDDWRLPNLRELRSLVDYSTYEPAIDEAFFPATPSWGFWSASSYAYYSSYAWIVAFYSGSASYSNKSSSSAVRLVRGGQWFGLLSLSVSVSGNGNGSGTVTSDPAGINCGSDCSEAYASGTEITLTATPAAGSELTGWSETSCGTATRCTLRLDSAKTVTVTFARISHAIQTSANPSNGGSLSCSPNPVEHGSNSNCTASPASGYRFIGWSGDCTGTSPSCTLSNVNSAQAVTASFEPLPPPSHAIQTSANPSNGGSLSCSPNPVSHGSNSSCTASPANGYRFIGWSGDCTGTSLSCTLSNVTSAQAVTASFEPEPPPSHAIQTSANPSNGGSLSCSPNPVPNGSDSRCTASPASGYRFTGWGDDCASASASAGTSPSCTLSNVTSAKTVSAQFISAGQPAATHATLSHYIPGTLLTVTGSFHDPAASELYALTWTPVLPTGWAVVSAQGDGSPQVRAGDNQIVFNGNLQQLPIAFSYQISVDPNSRGTQVLSALVSYQSDYLPEATDITAEPGALRLQQQPIQHHSADYREPYWQIDGSEYDRVLTYWRARGYHVEPGTADGYATHAGSTDGPRHSADYQDPAWRIDTFEANRLLAYWRAQAYRTEPGGFDGYAPGDRQTLSAQAATPAGRLGTVADAAPAGGLDTVADATPSGRLSTVADATAPQASQSSSSDRYSAGGSLSISHRIGQAGDPALLSLLWESQLPEGWRILPNSVSGQGDPALSPDGDAILFLAEALTLPLSFDYQVEIPASARGQQTLRAQLSYQRLGMHNPASTAPSPLQLSDGSSGPGPCSPNALNLTAPLTSGTQTQTSEVRINVANSVYVAPGARLELRAPRIDFAPGFRVLPGGQLSAIADPGVICPAASATLDPRSAAAAKAEAEATAASTGTASEAMGADAEKMASLTESSAPAPATTPATTPASAPILATDPAALPIWLHDQLHALGIDPEHLSSSLLDADEHWLILETRQALHQGDHNGVSDLYRLDLLSDQLALISATEQGRAGNGPSRHPAADARGELIVFESEADDLVASASASDSGGDSGNSNDSNESNDSRDSRDSGDSNDTQSVSDLFLHDLALSQTTRLTHTEQASAHPAVDALGLFLVYDQTRANGPRQILGQALSEGAAAEAMPLSEAAVDAYRPALSADGRFLAYLSQASQATQATQATQANQATQATQANQANQTSHNDTDCRIILRDRLSGAEHHEACPIALQQAGDQARLRFTADGQALYWSLPDETVPLAIANPLANRAP